MAFAVGCHENSDLRPQTPKTDPENSDPSIYIVNSSQLLSPDNLWSRNVHRQPPERSVYIYHHTVVGC